METFEVSLSTKAGEVIKSVLERVDLAAEHPKAYALWEVTKAGVKEIRGLRTDDSDFYS